jgi:regulator of Ty1 transposition protein 109
LLDSDELSNQIQESKSCQNDETKQPEESVNKLSSDIAPPATSAEAKNDNRALSSLQDHGQSAEVKADKQKDYSAFFWPEAGRGEVILSDADYKNVNDVLLEQDFETEDLSVTGTMAWIRKVASLVDILWWGQPVTGKKNTSDEETQPSTETSVMDSKPIVQKRKKDTQETASSTSVGASEAETSTTKQDETHETQTASKRQAETPAEISTPGVNILNASFIRKKKKT